jgi:hypothetical protein
MRSAGTSTIGAMLLWCALGTAATAQAADVPPGHAFYEQKIRPLLVEHCYACHSEQAKEQQGGLLLDRRSGWLKGGQSEKAVVPGDPEASLLIRAVRYSSEELQMPPERQLAAEQVRLLEEWIRRGAPGPKDDLGDTEFSRLGDQEYLFAKAKQHWAFQPVDPVEPSEVPDPSWNEQAVDRFVFSQLAESGLAPSRPADPRTFLRRLTYDLTGLPPTPEAVDAFAAAASVDYSSAVRDAVDEMLASPAFGEHFGRLWLDVARYADTDSFYSVSTRTPHYFPFAFTYRDYVVDAFNADKPYDQFLREQLAADLMGFQDGDAELAALGFLAVGPHVNRFQPEALDDWIDVTTRGLMGLTVACARCHDHKYEPIPTADYYSLHGVFASIVRTRPLDEENLPAVPGYDSDAQARSDYQQQRARIDAKIEAAGKGRAEVLELRETELAELLAFHPGAPAHTMIVRDRPRPIEPVIFVRGDPRSRGDSVPRRFLKVLDPAQEPFPLDSSGRLQLAHKIAAADNPLTARVFVNRVWGCIMGSHLVATPSDFGLQGAAPTHPQLLDWLAADFTAHGWSLKRLVRTIVLSRTYAQSSDSRAAMAAIDPESRQLWRANRKHLSIEGLRDSLLCVAGQLDRTPRGRPGPLWGENYTRRRAIYGFIDRYNLDPTLRVFDFPTPMQSQPARGESIVAPQALFHLNAPFVIDQALALTESEPFAACNTDDERIAALFRIIFQRAAAPEEARGILQFVKQQQRFFRTPAKGSRINSPWPLAAQALLMSNEFQYVD